MGDDIALDNPETIAEDSSDNSQKTFISNKVESQRLGPYLGWNNVGGNTLGDMYYTRSLPALILGQLSWIISAWFFGSPLFLSKFDRLENFRTFNPFIIVGIILSFAFSLYFAYRQDNFYSLLLNLAFYCCLGFFTAFLLISIEESLNTSIVFDFLLIFTIIQLTPFIILFISSRLKLYGTPGEYRNFMVLAIISLLIISMIIAELFQLPNWGIATSLIYMVINMVILFLSVDDCMDDLAYGYWMAAPFYYMVLYFYFILRFCLECIDLIFYIIVGLADAA